MTELEWAMAEVFNC